MKKRNEFDPALVIGVRLPEDMEHIQFGKIGPPSPYADLIRQLINSPDGTAIEFQNESVKNSLNVQARKADVKLEFAFHEGHFFVRLSDGDTKKKPITTRRPMTEGVATAPRPTLTSAVLIAVQESPRTTAEIKDRVLELLPDTSRDSVDQALFALKKRGDIAKHDDMCWSMTGTGALRK